MMDLKKALTLLGPAASNGSVRGPVKDSDGISYTFERAVGHDCFTVELRPDYWIKKQTRARRRLMHAADVYMWWYLGPGHPEPSLDLEVD